MGKELGAPNERLPGDPTPLEIRQACEKLQASWSECQRARALGRDSKDLRPTWQPAVIPLKDVWLEA